MNDTKLLLFDRDVLKRELVTTEIYEVGSKFNLPISTIPVYEVGIELSADYVTVGYEKYVATNKIGNVLFFRRIR